MTRGASQSTPTPSTIDPALVVVMVAVGAPLAPLRATLAAPASVACAPVNAITVIDFATGLLSVALTVMAECAVGANAHHTSAVPSCALDRTARVQVRAPVVLVTLFTCELAAQHGSGASDETNATSSEFAGALNAGLAIVVDCVLKLRLTLTAIVGAAPLETTIATALPV